MCLITNKLKGVLIALCLFIANAYNSDMVAGTPIPIDPVPKSNGGGGSYMPTDTRCICLLCRSNHSLALRCISVTVADGTLTIIFAGSVTYVFDFPCPVVACASSRDTSGNKAASATPAPVGIVCHQLVPIRTKEGSP